MQNSLCKKCNVVKPIEHFVKRCTKRGYAGNCRDCRKQYRLDNKEHHSAYNKKYRELNKETIVANWKQYYESNAERINARKRGRSNSIGVKYSHLKSASKKRGFFTTISLEQYEELIKNRTCYYCDFDYSQNTGHSLNRIDSDKEYTIDNVKPCCGTCNTIMMDFTLEELRGRLSPELIKRIEESKMMVLKS